MNYLKVSSGAMWQVEVDQYKLLQPDICKHGNSKGWGQNLSRKMKMYEFKELNIDLLSYIPLTLINQFHKFE